MKTMIVFAATLLAFVTLVSAQPDFSQVGVKATHVAGNIYMLTGAGGNIGVSAGPDGILIVDDQFAPLAPRIEAVLKELNPGKLKFVLNTHYHGDHTGGNIKKAPPDAKLIPGHGPLSTVKELKEFHEMLVETSGIVEKAIAAGKTLDQIKADGLPEKWKTWAVPTLTTDRWLEILYRGLKPK